MQSPIHVFISFFILFSSQAHSTACDSSDTATASGADFNTNCTVTNSETGTEIQLNFYNGFSDTTVITEIDGNNGTTVGAQRKLSFIKAAELIAAQIDSPQSILIDANFTNLTCDASSAVLGSAGASGSVYHPAPGTGEVGIIANTYYPVGLYNAITNSDVSGGSDINAEFNVMIGSTGCLQGSNGWYYGFDTPSTNYIGFTTVLLHEITHGLGFASLTSASTGAKTDGLDDIFSNFLYSLADSKSWSIADALTDGEIAASAISESGLLWAGTNVNSYAIGLLTNGFNNAGTGSTSLFEADDKIEMYAPNPVEGGSSVSHFNTAVSPNELMEPQYTEGQYTLGLAIYLLKDIGWTIYEEPNTAPNITITGTPYSTNEDTVKVIDASSWGSDSDGDGLTYSVSSCPANISCAIASDGQNLTLTPASNYNGATNSVEITVTDDGTGALSASASFNLVVVAQNDTPSLTITGTPYSTNEDTMKVIDASSWGSDSDGDGLTYSVSSCPANISCAIDSDGQNLTLTPTSNYNGATNSIEITVTDDGTGTLSTSASFNLAVVAQNDTPNLTITGTPYSTNEDTVKVIDASSWGSDTDGDGLTYAVSSCPANISCAIDSDGQNLTLTPASNYNGATNSIEITVTDDGTGTLSASASFNLAVFAQNDAPQWSAISTQNVTIGGSSVDVDLAAFTSDVEGDTLSYSEISCGTGISCSLAGSTMTLSGISNAGTTVTVEVQADDSNGGQSNQTFSVNINTAGNTAPTITITITGSPYSTNEDTVKVIDASSWDADVDGDAITFTVSSCPANISCAIDSDGQNLTLTPANNYNGATNSVEITVTDDGTGNLSASASFNLAVVAQNDTPSLTITGTPYSTNEDTVKVIDASSWDADVDGDAITFTVSSCPANISCAIDSDGQNLTLTPASNYNGATNSVEITVTDDGTGNLSASASFNLAVVAQNDTPSLTITGTPYSTNEDTVKVIDASSWGSDSDGDGLTYSVSSCPANISCAIDSDGQNLILTPASNYNGATNSVEITVTDDGTGTLSASASFNLAVVAQNDAPQWTTIPDQNAMVGDEVTLNLNSFATDDDGDALSFTGCEATAICSIANNTLTVNTATVATETITISAADTNGGSTDSASFTISITEALPSTYGEINGTNLQDGDAMTIALATTSLSINGGSGTYEYTLEYQGATVNHLLTATPSGVDVAMPSNGAFAGSYTLFITDTSNAQTIDITLVRPLRAIWSSDGLLNGDSTQTLRIEGGAVGSEYELMDGNGLLSFNQDGLTVTSVLATDNAAQFNGAEVTLHSETVTDLQTVDLSISTLNENYPVLTETTFAIYPASLHTFTITDDNAAPLQNATLTLTSSALLASLNLALVYETNPQGIVIIALPTVGSGFTLQASLANYTGQSISFDNSQLSHAITLSDMENSITLSGTINALGLQNFITEPPSVSLKLSDGSNVPVSVTVSTASQAAFSHEVDLNQFSLQSLLVSQADSLTAEIDLRSTTQNFKYNIFLETNVVVVVSAPKDTSVGSTGGGLGLFTLLALGIALIRRFRINTV